MIVNIPKFVLVDKTQPHRIIAIVEQTLADFFRKNFPAFEVKTVNKLSFSIVVDSNVGRFEFLYSESEQVYLLEKPHHMSVDDAYHWVINNLFVKIGSKMKPTKICRTLYGDPETLTVVKNYDSKITTEEYPTIQFEYNELTL